MKNTEKNSSILALIAFIGVILIAILEIFGFLATHNILTVGGALVDCLNTIKNLCILLVIGITAYYFVKGKSKALLIIYIIAMCIIVLTTVFIWIKF